MGQSSRLLQNLQAIQNDLLTGSPISSRDDSVVRCRKLYTTFPKPVVCLVPGARWLR
jgi:hypothetical protein